MRDVRAKVRFSDDSSTSAWHSQIRAMRDAARGSEERAGLRREETRGGAWGAKSEGEIKGRCHAGRATRGRREGRKAVTLMAEAFAMATPQGESWSSSWRRVWWTGDVGTGRR